MKLFPKVDFSNLQTNYDELWFPEREETIDEFLECKGPILCEFKVIGEECLPLVGPGRSLDDMILFDEYEEDNVERFDKSFVPS